MKTVFLRRILFLMGAAVVVAGCSKPESEIEPDGTDSDKAVKIIATASTEQVADTRLGYQESERGMTFTWKDHADGKKEAFSVFIFYGPNIITTFTQTNAGGGNKGTFKGTFEGTVTIAKGKEFVAVYPALSGSPRKTAVPLDLSTQTLATAATGLDGNASHYLRATAVYQGEGSALTFNFKHVVSILKVEMSFPAGAAAITEVKLSGVCAQANFNALYGDLIFTDMRIGCSLYDAIGIALTADRKLTAYIYLFPDDLSGELLRLTAIDVNGKAYEVDFVGRKVLAGKLYTLAQEMKEVFASKLQTGDFYLNDGTIISKDAILTDDQKARCIGIVFKPSRDVGGQWGDNCIYMQKDGITPMPTIHGYVLALTDANGGEWCKWGPISNAVKTNSLQLNGFYGYKNTQIITKYAIDHKRELQANYPATYWATVGYDTQENGKYAAPANSSGWFLPSAGQCNYWLTNKEVLLASLNKVIDGSNYKDYYWSSSEGYLSSNNAWIMHFKPEGHLIDNSKLHTCYVRPIFAF